MSQEPPVRALPLRSGAPGRAVRATLRTLGAALPRMAVAVLVAVCAAWIGLASALLVLFGGGAAIAVALLGLGAALLLRERRAGPWLVVPLLAVAIPAVAVAASGKRVDAQHGVRVHTPLTPAELPTDGYRTGLGEQLVDLRRMTIPPRRTVVLKARSDLDRTVVALPRAACWNVEVRWRTGRLWLPGIDAKRWIEGVPGTSTRDGGNLDAWARRERGDFAAGRSDGRIALFGRVRREPDGRWVSRVADPDAPTLRIDLRSAGSSFAVRDYPESIGPLGNASWPLDLRPPARPDQLREAWSSPGNGPESARRWRRYRVDRAAFVGRAKRLMAGDCDRRLVTP